MRSIWTAVPLLCALALAPIASADVNVMDFADKGDGASPTRISADGLRLALARAVAGPDRTIVFPPGEYLMPTWTIAGVEKAPITIRGQGTVVWEFPAGASGLVLGVSDLVLGASGFVPGAKAAPVRRLTIENVEIRASGPLKDAVSLNYAVDCVFRDLRIRDAAHIENAVRINYSWDNDFHHLLTSTPNGVIIEDQGNRNSFFGLRLEGPGGESRGAGVTLTRGAANAFYGADISSHEYAFRIAGSAAVTISGGYFEGNTRNDIYFDGTAPASGAAITGNYFNVRAYGTDAIAVAEGAHGANGVSISGNHFIGVPKTAFIVLSSQAWGWDIGANALLESAALVAGEARAHGTRILSNRTQLYQVNPAGTSGTVTIDSVAHLTAGGAPTHVRVTGTNHDGLQSFEIIAILTTGGALGSSRVLHATAEGLGVQVEGGELQVTNLALGNYAFFVETRSYSSSP